MGRTCTSMRLGNGCRNLIPRCPPLLSPGRFPLLGTLTRDMGDDTETTAYTPVDMNSLSQTPSHLV